MFPTSTPVNVTDASHPFNKSSADAILRTSDNVDFWVRRSILAEASSIFEDMLGMPQPPSGSAYGDELKDGLPVIYLSENSATLDRLLRLCYPTDDPQFDSLDELRLVLQAALKYMMQEATTLLRKRLVKLGQAQPLRAFCIACSLELELEAASLAPLAHSKHGKFVDEYRDISAGVWYRLGHHVPQANPSSHKQKRQRSSPVAVEFIEPPFKGFQEPSEKATVPPELLNMRDTDLTLRTLDGVDFRVHATVLSLASPVLSVLLPHEPDIFRVTEESHILSHLLLYIYPFARPPPPDLATLKPLLAAAKSYKLSAVLNALRPSLLAHLRRTASDTRTDAGERALRVFAIAHQFDFPEERTAAARALLQLSQKELRDLYVRDLEDIDAATYFRLLEYHDNCGRAAAARVLAHALEYTGLSASSSPATPATSSSVPQNPPPLPPSTPAVKSVRFASPSSSPTSTSSNTTLTPPSPRTTLLTPRGHTNTCHVLLDDSSSPSWAVFRQTSAPRWWLMYLYKLAVVLRARPAARAVVLDRGMQRRALARAVGCGRCREAFVPGFAEYAEERVREVERAVDGVRFEC